MSLAFLNALDELIVTLPDKPPRRAVFQWYPYKGRRWARVRFKDNHERLNVRIDYCERAPPLTVTGELALQ